MQAFCDFKAIFIEHFGNSFIKKTIKDFFKKDDFKYFN